MAEPKKIFVRPRLHQSELHCIDLALETEIERARWEKGESQYKKDYWKSLVRLRRKLRRNMTLDGWQWGDHRRYVPYAPLIENKVAP